MFQSSDEPLLHVESGSIPQCFSALLYSCGSVYVRLTLLSLSAENGEGFHIILK